MRRILTTTALLLGLAGCGGLVPPAPVTPGPAEINAEVAALSAISAPPADVLSVGVELSNRQCSAYFNNLTLQADQLNFAQQETTLAGGVTTGLLGVTGASASGVAIAGILFPAISQSMANAARTATGGVLPPAAYTIVTKAQSTWLGLITPPSSIAEAMADVTSYAALCQPAQINAFVMQSQLNATTTAGTGGAAPNVVTPAGASVPRPPVIQAH